MIDWAKSCPCVHFCFSGVLQTPMLNLGSQNTQDGIFGQHFRFYPRLGNRIYSNTHQHSKGVFVFIYTHSGSGLSLKTSDFPFIRHMHVYEWIYRHVCCDWNNCNWLWPVITWLSPKTDEAQLFKHTGLLPPVPYPPCSVNKTDSPFSVTKSCHLLWVL